MNRYFDKADNLYNEFSEQFRNSQLAMMQAIIKAHQAPVRDVLAVKKNREKLDANFKKHNCYETIMFFDSFLGISSFGKDISKIPFLNVAFISFSFFRPI